MALTWQVNVDWDNDGTRETNEASRVIGIDLMRGRQKMMGSGTAGLQKMAVGRCVLTLNNGDGRFDPRNTGSAIYPNVQPGREVQIKVSDGITTWTVFTGMISEPVLYDYADPKAKFEVKDGWQWLKDNNCFTPVFTNLKVNEAIQKVLESADWPYPKWALGTAGRGELGQSTYLSPATGTARNWNQNLEDGDDVIPYWWADGKAYEEISELIEADFGFGFVAVDGKFTYLNRKSHYGQVSAVTITQSQVLRDMKLGGVGENLRNISRVDYSGFTPQTLAEIWRESGTPEVPPGTTLEVEATWSTPATGILTPVATTDFIANTRPDGAGSNQTTAITVSLSSNAQRATISIINPLSVSVFMTLLRLRGQSLLESNVSRVEKVNVASQAAYGTATIIVNNKWVQTSAKATPLATWMLSWMKDPTENPVIAIEARPDVQFARELGDVITLDFPKVGLNAQFRIGQIQHRDMGSMQKIKTIWHLEPFMQQAAWLLGTTGKSELGQTTSLAF